MDVQEIVERAEVSEEGPVSRRMQQVLLSAVADGHLVAGDVLHDGEWAAAMHASRTPMREAIQSLQGMGLLDVAAARYTRLRTFTPEQAVREAQDWALLHQALMHSVIDRIPDGLVDGLCRIRDALVGQTHPDHVRIKNFHFFHALRSAFPHSAVTLGATAAAYRLRLAEPNLHSDANVHTNLHDGVIHALTLLDVEHAYHALTAWAAHLARATRPADVVLTH